METIQVNYNNEIYKPVMMKNPLEMTEMININYNQISTTSQDSSLLFVLSLVFFAASIYISRRSTRRS